jgi:hypothetical protein
MKIEAMQVFIEGKGDKENYEITAIDAETQKVHTILAGALNLNGYAFATSGLDMGEYGKTITLEQESGSRYLNLSTEGGL